MSKERTVTCDACGTKTRDATKWWGIMRSTTSWHEESWNCEPTYDFDVCSRQCSQKKHDEWLAEQEAAALQPVK